MLLIDLLIWGIVCPLSAVCSCLLMVSIALVLHNNINRSQRLHYLNIFWMAFCDLGTSINGFMIYFYPDLGTASTGCSIRGFMTLLWGIGTVGWYFILCLNIFLTIKKSTIHKYMKKGIILHIFVWGISLFVAAPPFQHYEQLNDGVCGINSPDNKMFYWGYVTLIPQASTFLFSLVVLFLVSRTLNSLYDEHMRRTILYRTRFFVFAFDITWGPTIIMEMLSPVIDLPPILHKILVIPYFSNGMVNFFVWFVSFDDLQNSLLDVWRNHKIMNKPLSQPLVNGDEKKWKDESVCTKTIQNRKYKFSSNQLI